MSLVNTYPQAVRLTVNGMSYELAVDERRAVQVTPGTDSDSVSIASADGSCSTSRGGRYFAPGHDYTLTVSSGGSCGAGAAPAFTVAQL